MSAQDETEQVLRDIHILFSKSEFYDKETNRIIVNKKEMLELLNRLNTCIYQIMEEHELTKQSRDKAEREARKRGEDIVWDATRKAEDVYAASVMYTNEALYHVQQIMQQTSDSVKEIYDRMNQEFTRERELVKHDQIDLKSHLEELLDTEKYLKIIDEQNKLMKKEKEKDKEPEEQEPSHYAAVKPEIKVDAEYFKRAGIPLEEDLAEEETEEPEAHKDTVQAEINVNLDAEYFKWVEEGENYKEEKKTEKNSGFLRKFF